VPLNLIYQEVGGDVRLLIAYCSAPANSIVGKTHVWMTPLQTKHRCSRSASKDLRSNPL